MAFVQRQIDLINSLLVASTITDAQAVDLLSSPDGFSTTQISFIQGLGLDADDEALLLAENRSTQASIEADIATARTAMLANDITTARKYVLAAEMTMASIPDNMLGNRHIQYREGIRFIKNSLTDLEARVSTDSKANQRIYARYRGR